MLDGKMILLLKNNTKQDLHKGKTIRGLAMHLCTTSSNQNARLASRQIKTYQRN